jgi:hypothetical protein
MIAGGALDGDLSLRVVDASRPGSHVSIDLGTERVFSLRGLPPGDYDVSPRLVVRALDGDGRDQIDVILGVPRRLTIPEDSRSWPVEIHFDLSK